MDILLLFTWVPLTSHLSLVVFWWRICWTLVHRLRRIITEALPVIKTILIYLCDNHIFLSRGFTFAGLIFGIFLFFSPVKVPLLSVKDRSLSRRRDLQRASTAKLCSMAYATVLICTVSLPLTTVLDLLKLFLKISLYQTSCALLLCTVHLLWGALKIRNSPSRIVLMRRSFKDN